MSDKIIGPNPCQSCGGEYGQHTSDCREPQKPTERLIRPVKCHFCNQPMFYTGDERYEPEISVAVNGPEIAEDFYAHVRCWNERMGPR